MLELRFHLDPSDGSLVYRQCDAALVAGPIRVRLPERLAPQIVAREDPSDVHRTRISVRVTLPAVGLLIAYDGTVDFEELHA